jgi:hypothetical protein
MLTPVSLIIGTYGYTLTLNEALGKYLVCIFMWGFVIKVFYRFNEGMIASMQAQTEKN